MIYVMQWKKILSVAKSSVNDAKSIAALIAVLLASADTSDVVTAHTTPYLSALLAGKDSIEGGAKNKDTSATSAASAVSAAASAAASAHMSSGGTEAADHRLSQDLEQCPPPARARVLYLPPGQPGDELADMLMMI